MNRWIPSGEYTAPRILFHALSITFFPVTDFRPNRDASIACEFLDSRGPPIPPLMRLMRLIRGARSASIPDGCCCIGPDANEGLWSRLGANCPPVTEFRGCLCWGPLSGANSITRMVELRGLRSCGDCNGRYATHCGRDGRQTHHGGQEGICSRLALGSVVLLLGSLSRAAQTGLASTVRHRTDASCVNSHLE
eukprot:1195925-Prorocentrum_minimum.AAC.1